MSKFSHTDSSGSARMVDVSEKKVTSRTASASVKVILNSETFELLRENKLAKGDVLTVAQIAGIQAAKKTWELIPLCHPLPLDQIEISFNLNDTDRTVLVTASARTEASTGVEMEAMTACSIAALTIYDMVKAVQRDVVIGDLKLLSKSGGQSGEFRREDS